MAETTSTAGGKTFHLEVVSPEGVLFDLPARSIVAPGADGMLGVLVGHAPLVTPLVPDVLKIVGGDGKEIALAIGSGFLQVADDQVRVLVDSAERADEIDVERAEEARRRAEERLKRRGATDIDFVRAEVALRRAIARLKVAGRTG
ncbi:MAG: F0F1 ATP synthase subunit epsilon [Planctomycetota bacterium JB042]